MQLRAPKPAETLGAASAFSSFHEHPAGAHWLIREAPHRAHQHGAPVLAVPQPWQQRCSERNQPLFPPFPGTHEAGWHLAPAGAGSVIALGPQDLSPEQRGLGAVGKAGDKFGSQK